MKFIFLLLATLIFTEDIYDYENILTKDPKVSVNFLFDDKTFSSSSNKAFDNYFNTFYETELPLYNGALMSCHIPNKISLSHSTNDLNESSLITNISLNYGYIFLREVSALCFNSFEDKWYYKLCPTRKAVQTLSYNKIDEKTGKLKRPYIYLWDDNFLASPYWDRLLDELIATGRPFQFRQGLDERLLAQNRRGEEMADKLSKANYHGDFIFAFDNWFDRNIIVKALKIWKYYCPKKETKFYLLDQARNDTNAF